MNLAEKTNYTLFESLDAAHQEFIKKIAREYRLTHQELRELCESACDLQQWEEISLVDWWYSEERVPLPVAILTLKPVCLMAPPVADLARWPLEKIRA